MNADELAQVVQSRGVAKAVAAGCAARRDTRGGWAREVGGAAATLFDLASLTKPMTAVAAVRAGIDPTAPLGAMLAEVRGTASEGVSLELLLAHRAGLGPHRALYAPLAQGERVDAGAALREAAETRRADAGGPVPAEGFGPVYSDLGYILAGEAIARTLGLSDGGKAIERLVLEPLGIERQAGTVRDLALRGVDGPFAPTEDVPWRGGSCPVPCTTRTRGRSRGSAAPATQGSSARSTRF